MAFFQTDLDPIYLREKHRETLPLKLNNGMVTKQQQQTMMATPTYFTTTKIFHYLFKGSPIKENCSRITSDPMNRLVSFHL